MIMVYTTCKDEAEAKKVADHLLSKRLIACANIFPVRSVYRWKGETVDEPEHVLVAKSLKGKGAAIEAAIREVHSYEVPLIEMIDTTANDAYVEWLKGEVR